MRTKIMVLSALLGTLGSASLMAQSTNVYSLNAVGYVNVTIAPGFNLIADPLLAAPDNTIGTVLNNANSNYNGDQVFFYSPVSGYSIDTAQIGGKRGTANADGWVNNGTNVLAPGVGAWLFSTATTNVTVTFVGTVPQGSLTNVLTPGYNLVSSIVPTSGDIITNSITSLTNYNLGDAVYTYTPGTGYTVYSSSAKRGTQGYHNNWEAPGDPVTATVSSAFFYFNSGATVDWVENFSVSQ
jgi:hypothetical protein